ncbi:Kinesin KIF23, partial [Brachionus plicatilis]
MSKKLRTTARVDPVEVYCRIRPLPNETDESCLKILDKSNLMLQIPECSASYRTGQIKQLVYSFTQIYDEQTSQKQLFEQVSMPLVQDLLNAKNGLMFTYGVTGSGKTYSMIGNQHESGMLQRSLDCLFQSIQGNIARKNIFKPDRMNSFEIQSDCEGRLSNPAAAHSTKLTRQQQAFLNELQLSNKFQCQINRDNYYAVYISCIEIYNNYIYDLLDDVASSSTPTMSGGQDLKESKNLKEDSKGCMYIKDVNELEVKTIEEALDLISKAQKKRVVAYTELNSESSRSHSIFSIRLVQSQCSGKQCPVYVSQLSLVDLAGSERSKRTKNTGSRLREAGSINSSLMALRNCIETLRENSLNGYKKMVPYRDSKLTLLFKNYFEGNGKIKMILCINPNSVEFDETS